MTNTNRVLVITIALLLVPSWLYAAAAFDDEPGWWFSQRFQGSSNSAGVVLKMNSTVGYRFGRYASAYGGLPVYFARESSTAATSGSPQYVDGIGNLYAGLLLSAGNRVLNYSSDLVVAAPTGDRSRGFSTGHPTIDWTNTFRHSFSVVTPYASVGAANTISDTSFFVRPFSSKGVVSHFEGGALVDVSPRVSVGASGYGVRATGEQTIISKVVEPPPQQQAAGLIPIVVPGLGLGRQASPAVFQTQSETLGPPEIANDHGLSTWLTVRPGWGTDFQIGYSRSAKYQFNSVFFGLGFRVGH